MTALVLVAGLCLTALALVVTYALLQVAGWPDTGEAEHQAILQANTTKEH